MTSSVTIDGASNFRALPFVKRGSLFRSDHLGALNGDDARQIQALGIRRVLDFRGIDERMSAACVLPDVTVHSLAIEPTIVQVLHGLMAAGHRITPAEVVAHMQDTYRGFVRLTTHRFAELFAHLLESNEPTVFHCTAGKDRTGFAAALILRSLGVPQEEVMRDYLRTNDLLKMPDPSRFGLTPEVAGVLWRVQPEFLGAAFEAADEDYGGLDAYLREGLGLGPTERSRMVELYSAL
ncbi:MAG: tyrosine-protein phosphatase [Ramlibacter sp.]|nr:tyrosine-protein phosphatase [Ramlibacter sp.]